MSAEQRDDIVPQEQEQLQSKIFVFCLAAAMAALHFSYRHLYCGFTSELAGPRDYSARGMHLQSGMTMAMCAQDNPWR